MVVPDRRWVEGMVQAFLARHAVHVHGLSPEAVRVPLWLQVVLAEVVAARFEPALADVHALRARAEGPAPLGALFAVAAWEEVGVREATSAWWLVRWLTAVPEGRRRLDAWVAGVLGGGDARAGLLAAFGDLPEFGAGAQAAWLAGFHGASRSAALPVAPVEETLAEAAGLARIVVEVDGVERVLGPAELWAWRRSRLLRGVVADREVAVRALLLDAHPVAFNAVLSLGQALEALRRGQEAAFREAWRRHGEDVAVARDLAAAVREVLREAETRGAGR